jgi:L-ascorbate 6-phosphate lactonase
MSIQGTPEKDTVFFTWFNQYAGILLKTPTKTLVIDPVDIKVKDLHNVDAILITHEHYDHLDPPLIEGLQKDNNCDVIVDSTSLRKLQNVISKEKLVEVKPGVEIKIGEVTVKAEKCNHPAQTPVTYVVTSENNLKSITPLTVCPFLNWRC